MKDKGNEPVKLIEKGECETPCGMNHCDTNGCSERKRYLVEDHCDPLESVIHINATPEFFKDKKAMKALGELVKLASKVDPKDSVKPIEGESECADCKKEIGNNIFTICDDCWDKSFLLKKQKEPMIPLAEAMEFAEWCSNERWEYFKHHELWHNIEYSGLGIKTTTELRDIFRSGKEKDGKG